MESSKHPDFPKEAQHLSYTKEYIEKTLKTIDRYLYQYKGDMKEAFQQLDLVDSSSEYINILVNAKFMEMAEKNYISLSKVKDKPYFARIDFKSQGSDKIEELYIGKASLSRLEDNKQLIIDWRAPVASVYYEGRLGHTSYPSVDGEEYGELLLKRQFQMENGKLKEIIDIDVAANDPLLQSALKTNAEKRLKDIASTIQGEQNRVIRADMHVPLIVQGVAGSGKTTIALHRIAYFIYTYEATFNPDNFMIIAPNRMFINYISEVLPELGVEEVKQTTYIDLMEELLEKKVKLTDTSEKLMNLMEAVESEREKIIWASKFKGSMEFKNIIDNYIKDIEANYYPPTDFVLIRRLMITVEEIKNYIRKEFNYLPLYKRDMQLKKVLRNRLKRDKVKLIEEVKNHFEKRIEDVRSQYPDPLERQKHIVPVIEKRDRILNNINKEAPVLVKKYMSLLKKEDLMDCYQKLLTDPDLLYKYAHEKVSLDKLKEFAKKNSEIFNKGKYELEDLAPLVYLKHLLYGFKERMDIRTVVIDEAQDFSVFQMYVVKEILDTEQLTLLGDISQGIHSYRGIDGWDEITEKVFTKRKSNFIALEQSYRTTIEIMEVANEVIKNLSNPNLILAKPVIRHGKKPTRNWFASQGELLDKLSEKLLILEQKYKSVAIICKTKGEAINIKKNLDKGKKIKAKLLDEKEESYEAGVIVVPSHLAKGLEFDSVVIVNIEESYNANELDIKLLYVALTRALHKVDILCIEGKNPILARIPESFFN